MLRVISVTRVKLSTASSFAAAGAMPVGALLAALEAVAAGGTAAAGADDAS